MTQHSLSDNHNTKKLTKNQVACITKQLKLLYKELKPALVYDKPHEFLIAVILSAQTTDVQVNKVTKKLFQKYKSISDFAKTSAIDLQKDIASIGLFRAKAKNIVACAEILQDKYVGSIPATLDQLVELPGVGRKTANVG